MLMLEKWHFPPLSRKSDKKVRKHFFLFVLPTYAHSYIPVDRCMRRKCTWNEWMKDTALSMHTIHSILNYDWSLLLSIGRVCATDFEHKSSSLVNTAACRYKALNYNTVLQQFHFSGERKGNCDAKQEADEAMRCPFKLLFSALGRSTHFAAVGKPSIC